MFRGVCFAASLNSFECVKRVKIVLKATRQKIVRDLVLKGESSPETIREHLKQKAKHTIRTETVVSDISEIQLASKQWIKRMTEGDILVRAQYFDEITLSAIIVLSKALSDLGNAANPGQQAHKLGQVWPQLESAMRFNLEIAEKFPLYTQTTELSKRAAGVESDD